MAIISAEPLRIRGLLANRHVQTTLPVLCKQPRIRDFTRQRLELPDGDFLDTFHAGAPENPTVCLFHGLEGSHNSHYVRRLAPVLLRHHFHVVFTAFRGCSGEPNRLPRGYHSGDTGDIAYVLDQVRQLKPGQPIICIGYSLGGNALLKHLGENPARCDDLSAIAVSVPFRLDRCAWQLTQGFSKVYQRWLLDDLYKTVRTKRNRGIYRPQQFEHVERLKTFRAFDHHVTARLHGFHGVDDYYQRSSCLQYLKHITCPALIIHSLDDPFVPRDSVPGPQDVSETVSLCITEQGGHVGFLDSIKPGVDGYWLERRILAACRRFSTPG